MLITIKGKIRGMGIGEIPKIGCWSVSRTRLMYTPAPVNGQPNHFSSHSNNNFPNHHSSHLEKAQRSNANGEAIHLLWLILCQWEGADFCHLIHLIWFVISSSTYLAMSAFLSQLNPSEPICTITGWSDLTSPTIWGIQALKQPAPQNMPWSPPKPAHQALNVLRCEKMD